MISLLYPLQRDVATVKLHTFATAAGACKGSCSSSSRIDMEAEAAVTAGATVSFWKRPAWERKCRGHGQFLETAC